MGVQNILQLVCIYHFPVTFHWCFLGMTLMNMLLVIRKLPTRSTVTGMTLWQHIPSHITQEMSKCHLNPTPSSGLFYTPLLCKKYNTHFFRRGFVAIYWWRHYSSSTAFWCYGKPSWWTQHIISGCLVLVLSILCVCNYNLVNCISGLMVQTLFVWLRDGLNYNTTNFQVTGTEAWRYDTQCRVCYSSLTLGQCLETYKNFYFTVHSQDIC